MNRHKKTTQIIANRVIIIKGVFNLTKVFYCYSPILKCELLKVGERYIAKSLNQKTNKYYWMFLYTDELIKYLENRPKKSH